MQKNKNKTNIIISSEDRLQKSIEKGTYTVNVDDVPVLSNFEFKAGAVYTIMIYESSNRTYVRLFKLHISIVYKKIFYK